MNKIIWSFILIIIALISIGNVCADDLNNVTSCDVINTDSQDLKILTDNAVKDNSDAITNESIIKNCDVFLNTSDETHSDKNSPLNLSANSNAEILNGSIFNGTTLTDLQNEVNNRNSGDVIVLKNNISANGFNPVSIKKSITIDGNGHTIDAQGKLRIFDVHAANVVIRNITFINAKRGVSIYTDHANYCNISYCNFINNNVESKNGSAIYLTFSDNCIINHCNFINNSAKSGNINLLASFCTDIGYCIFENNNALDGGAIMLSDGLSCNINKCCFKNNTASNCGGALFLSNSIVNLSDCVFENNAAYSDGGAIYIRGLKVILNNCTFENNAAAKKGGAICWTKDSGIVNYCCFVNNSAKRGSAIYYGTKNNTISNSLFLNNNVIYHLDVDNSSLRKVAVTLSNNENYINAIYSEYDVKFRNITYSNGLHTKTTDNPIRSHNAANQDIIFEITDSSNKSSNTTYITNDDGQVFLNHRNFPDGNYTLNVYHPINNYTYDVKGNCTFRVDSRGVFDLLQALIDSAQSNSVVTLSTDYVYESDRDMIAEGILINKPLTIDGRGHTIDGQGKSRIFKILSDNVTIMNLTLVNASYNASGGAVYWQGDNGIIDYCSFVNNFAVNGSAVYFENKNCTVSNSEFLNNSVLFYLNISTDIFGAVIVTLSNNANYLNAIYSKHDVKFKNASYWDGECMLHSDNPLKSQYVAMQDVILEIYDPENNLINISDRTDFDGEVMLNYLNFTEGNYNLKAYVLKNNRIPYLTKNCTFTVHSYGDFDLLQILILSAKNKNVITLSRNYTYNVDADTITEGIKINKPVTIDGNGYTIDALSKSRIFKILGDNVKIMNLNLINSISNDEGGAIYCQSNNFNITFCTFENNIAYKGASIYLNGFNGDISFCVFSKNYATRDGGAIFWNGNGSIESCAFENNYADCGGALSLDFTGNLSYCGFKNNHADYGGAIDLIIKSGAKNYCNIRYCSFDINSAQTSGGSISSSGNNLNIYNNIFNHNSAMVGGAISIINSKNNSLDSCSFKENAASKNGGAIYAIDSDYGLLKDCYFANNSGDLGGALYWRANYNIFNGCSFEYNVAKDTAGAVFATGFNNIINASVFRHNIAEDSGAIHCEYDNSILMGCIFEYNAASSGGALHWSGRYAILKNSIFENNAVNKSGGAVFWACKDSLLNNCSFVNNSAKSSGGAVYIRSVIEDIGNNIVNASVFRFNCANDGGAIYWDSEDSRLDDSVFEYNVAGDKGGAVYYKKFAVISDSVFLNNKANSTKLDLNITSGNINIAFSGNENYINAIYSEYGATFLNVSYWNGNIVNTDNIKPARSLLESGVNISLIFYDSFGKIIDNISLLTDEKGQINYILDNCPYYARLEVIHYDDNYYLRADEVIFNTGNFNDLKDLIENSTADNVISLACDYIYDEYMDNITEGIEINENNITVNGNGHIIDAAHKTGIFKINGGNIILTNITFMNAGRSISSSLGAVEINAPNIIISNCCFINNSALNGAAVNIDGPYATIDWCSFVNNTAKSSGGAIYCGETDCVINNSNMINNWAINGGAVYVDASYTTIDCCNIADNSARSSGGAIYCSGYLCVINNANITNNAAGDAGAIFLSSAQYCILSNINFIANRASNRYGGAVFISYSENSILNCNFVNNSAVYGGAVYIYSSRNTISDCNFVNDSAVYGGAIYVDGSNNVVNRSTFKYNSANCGGAIYWNGANGCLDYSVFEYNSANDKGGALYFECGAIISNSIFLNNKANITLLDLDVTPDTPFFIKEYLNSVYSQKSLTFSNITSKDGYDIDINDSSNLQEGAVCIYSSQSRISEFNYVDYENRITDSNIFSLEKRIRNLNLPWIVQNESRYEENISRE